MADLLKIYRALGSKKAVFLDLDNTLYRYLPCHRQGLQKSYALYRRIFGALPFREFMRCYLRARKKVSLRLYRRAASHSRLLYFQTFLESKYGRTDVQNSLRLEKAYWDAFVDRMRLAKWGPAFFRYCKARHIKIVIVTDLTAEIQMKKIRKLGIDRMIDSMVSSEEAGVEKPHAAIFKLALRKTGLSPAEVLVIGDERHDACSFMEFIKI